MTFSYYITFDNNTTKKCAVI